MSHVPEPDRSPTGPTYEGRPLVRPDDEVVDQGAGFDVATVLTRRRVLGLLGIGAGAVTLAACSAGGSTATTATGAGEIPEETNGPYPADGTAEENVLTESGIERSDITSSLDGGTTVDGVPLELTLAVTDLTTGAPWAGAAVYVWHCDARGRYSMYSPGVEEETWLRGLQVTDDAGEVRFTTIVPGCYSGRWTHVHLEVYPDAGSATDVDDVVATSQVALPPAMLADVYALDSYAGSTENLAGVGTQVSDDGLFGDGDWTLQVPEVSGDARSGYAARLEIGVDTTTEPGGASGGPGGGPAGGGPGGGEPPAGGPPAGGPRSG